MRYLTGILCLQKLYKDPVTEDEYILTGVPLEGNYYDNWEKPKEYFEPKRQPDVQPDIIIISDSEDSVDTVDIQSNIETVEDIENQNNIDIGTCDVTEENPIEIELETITIDDEESPLEVSSQLGISDELEFVIFDPNCNNSASIQLQRAAFACQESEENPSENTPHTVLQQNVSKPRLFNCIECNKGFFSNKTLKFHMQHKHRSKKNCSNESLSKEKHATGKEIKQFNCNECGKMYFSKNSLDFHQLREHGSKQECFDQPSFTNQQRTDQMEYRFDQPSLTDKQRTDRKRFNCYECAKSFTSKQGLDLHLFRKHTSEEDSCDGPSLIDHDQQCTDSKTVRYDCTLCAKSFTKRNNLILHRLNIHGKDKNVPAKQTLPDPDISILHQLKEDRSENEAFETKYPLKNELSSSTSNEFPCQERQRSFTSNKNLLLHQQHKHGIKKNQPKTQGLTNVQNLGFRVKLFTCFVCRKRFVTKLKLASHLQCKHPQQNPFRCSECGIFFADKTSLSRHHKTHRSDKKPYNCPHCKKSFSVRTLLDNHVTTHNFKCGVCDKTFYRKLHLTQHSLTHLQAESFSCPWCERKFDRKACLMTHMKTHSSAYYCDICGEAFNAQSFLIQHLKKHLSVMKAQRKS